MTEPATGADEPIGRPSRLRSASSCHNGYQNLGQVGKKNLKRILWSDHPGFAMINCCLLVAILAGGCKTDLAEPLQSGRVLALQGLQGRWVGQVVPTERSCGSTTQGLMSIGKGGFGFDPFRGVTVIRGDVSDDGHLVGKLVRQGPEHQDLSIAFEGVATGSDEITGALQSGRCHWTVTLHRG